MDASLISAAAGRPLNDQTNHAERDRRQFSILSRTSER
jgi:hypothetical protein